MFIVKPDQEGELLEAAIDRVLATVKKQGGEVVHLKKMGRRKFAYEIDGLREGFYSYAHIQAGHEIVEALEHFFKVNEGYLRHIIIRLEEDEKKKEAEKVERVEVTAEKHGQEESGEEQEELAQTVKEGRNEPAGE